MSKSKSKCLDCDDFRWCSHRVLVGEPNYCPDETYLKKLQNIADKMKFDLERMKEKDKELADFIRGHPEGIYEVSDDGTILLKKAALTDTRLINSCS